MRKTFLLFLIGLGLWCGGTSAEASHISIEPELTSLEIGETSRVNIYLDTEGNSINAIDLTLLYPPDRVQLVSPSTGQSIISIWTTQPRFDNYKGLIQMQGGIPGGIKSSRALIASFIFRGYATGNAILLLSESSRALLNDGMGTNDNLDSQSGEIKISLPPPLGPRVSSSHADQDSWYNNKNVLFEWAALEKQFEGFSYVLDQSPKTIPDNISDSNKLFVRYEEVPDGIHYFHIKTLSGGTWGDVTHYAVRIDATPPARFPINIEPSARTTYQSPAIKFETTDAASGISRYEIKLVPLEKIEGGRAQISELFMETRSPHLTSNMDLGKWDVIVRVYDNAGNFTEETRRLDIVAGVFKFINDEGIEIGLLGIVSWIWVWALLILFLGGLVFIAVFVDRWHMFHHKQLQEKIFPDKTRDDLKELKAYRKKYGKIILCIGFLWGVVFGGGGFVAKAQELAPPQITTFSAYISNQEIFYVGGNVSDTKSDVILYVQKEETGEIRTMRINPHQNGEWFYRHDTFLVSGDYIVWAQGEKENVLSPPSPQKKIVVTSVAFQIGASRMSKEEAFLFGMVLFLVLDVILLVFIVERMIRIRKKKAKLREEIREAEESIRRGFAVLQRDIIAELQSLKKGKNTSEIEKREREILEDLEEIKKYITKEVWDVEDAQRD